MPLARSCLLELGDELLVQQIFPKLDSLQVRDAANSCKRLSKAARLLLQYFMLDEAVGTATEHWPAAYSYAGVRCLEYYMPEAGMAVDVEEAQNPAQLVLPLLTGLLPRVCALWKHLRELALVLQPFQLEGLPKHANAYLSQQLPQLTALHSLRHLQLYKTAPLLLEDTQRLAQLTQLTSLLLADQSYKPGIKTMVLVDISPLSAMTKLRTLCIAGICPKPPAAMPPHLTAGLCELDQLAEWDEGVTAALLAAVASQRSSSKESSLVADLPSSLTSVMIKRVDDLALDLWSYHLLLQTPLREISVLEYLEPSSGQMFAAFPAPFLIRIAPELTELTELSFGISDVNNLRTQEGYVARATLPQSIMCLEHLQVANFDWCQVSVRTPADWHALASLTRLACLCGIDVKCVPPRGVQLLGVQKLGMQDSLMFTAAANAATGRFNFSDAVQQTIGDAGVWHLTATFPQLKSLHIGCGNSIDWLVLHPLIAEVPGLITLGLQLKFCLDEECAVAFETLGSQLPALRSLYLSYGGGPSAWRLPHLQHYTQLEYLNLQLSAPGLAVSDTVLQAHLYPLQGLKDLALQGMADITLGVALGLCAALRKLESLHFVQCEKVNVEDQGDISTSWDGSELQLTRAALDAAAARDGKDPCEVFVSSTCIAASRVCQDLPCDIDLVEAHLKNF